jgi:hypothetical protein
MASKKSTAATPASGIDLAGFDAAQKRVLLDLLVLAMYSDGDLAKVEEAHAQQLLTAMGFESDYDRGREFDASITRIRRQSQTPEAVKLGVKKLAELFVTSAQQQRVYDFLADFAAIDGGVTKPENQFLGFVKEAFGM